VSDKRKKHKFAAKREQRQLKQLAEQRHVVDGVEMPRGAVAADKSQQVSINPFSTPPEYYVDIEFKCRDCGRREVWTAEQQKWYYEVAKGSLNATAVRCRECRRIHKQQRGRDGDPNPVKHVGSLMKRIRRNIEPSLVEAGFEFDGKNDWIGFRSAWFDYSGPGLILRCLFVEAGMEAARFVAETLDDDAQYREVANIEVGCSISTSEVLERVDDFTAAVREFIRHLSAATDTSDGGDP